MRRFLNLVQKIVITLAQSGLRGLYRKAVASIRFRIALFRGSSAPGYEKKHFMDVLFINGCTLPHPTRYRVSHQKEQLLAYNITSDDVYYEDLTLELIKYYRVFVFFRCPFTDTIGEFIDISKKNNKTVLFDIDDLVIDRKYTDQIEYLKTMSEEDKRQYDDGVLRMQKVLRLCEGAITTTERLASELSNYVPEVFINRNTASERMVELSESAVEGRDVLPFKEESQESDKKLRKKIQQAKLHHQRRQDQVRIGYFSGSITHNSDFQHILPVISGLMQKHENLYLYVIGELTIPEELKRFQKRIVYNGFLPWEQLPELIASVDVNLAPVQVTIFNEAKSENKWVEAGLVKVPTVASNVGAMKRMILAGETGFLCDTLEEWEGALERLITDGQYRKLIGEAAYQQVKKNCITISTGYELAQYIRSKMKPNIAFVLPSLSISGGVLVALRHALILKKAGYDVLLISEGNEKNDAVLDQQTILSIPRNSTGIFGSFDSVVATLWSTVSFVRLYPNITNRFYLVQMYEPDFYKNGEQLKIQAKQTYSVGSGLNYITISKWCMKWLREDFRKLSNYAPNGIACEDFFPVEREFRNNRVCILIEGNSEAFYKNVDESFHITNQLDPQKFEIWYMSYQGKPKNWYKVDRFLNNISYDKVPDVYRQCHILLKTSIHESFSYPPLEMMSTGGFVVVVPNEGNLEYLQDGKNCLMYRQGDFSEGVEAIERICNDEALRQILLEGGLETAQLRDWTNLTQSILALYNSCLED